MSYQVLARKWRPRDFSALVGQQHVVRALGNGLDQGRLHHAFLLTGTRGVGKTTIARILAKALNCERGVTSSPCGECAHCVAIDEGRFVDLLEIDAASRTRVDDTREILDNVPYAPARGRYKVYLIDEVHMLSTSSFNALLKTLEEPPEHVKFVLATTDPKKIPVTILSRCLQFGLRRLQPDEISGQLRAILEAEQAQFEPAALELLARAADGSMRDGLSLLDQALAAGSGQLETALVEDMLGTVEQRHLDIIIDALAERNPAAALAAVGEAFSLARDLGRLLADLGERLHRIALVQQVPDYQDDSRSDWSGLSESAARFDTEDVQLYYEIALQGRNELRLAPSERCGCEMTVLRMFAFRPERPGEAGRADSATGAKPESVTGAVRSAAVASTAPVPEDRVEDQVAPPRSVRPDAAGAGRLALAPEHWAEVLERLEINGASRAVAANLALADVDDRSIRFHIASEDRALLSDRFRAGLQKALADWSGTDRVIEFDDAGGEPALEGTPAALARADREAQQARAEAALADDPVVREMQARFEAEILPGSVRPGNSP